MSLRTIILLIVALGSAAATALYARNWAAMQQAQVKESTPRLIAAPAPKPQPMVLVAARNLPIGAFVRKELLTWQPWPEDGSERRLCVA